MTPARAVELSLLEFFRHFARARKSGRVAELEGVSIASSGIEFYMFNAAFLATPPAGSGDLEKRIELAARQLGDGGPRWAFWAGAGMLGKIPGEHVSRAFRRWGLRPAFHHPGMACERLAPPRRTPVPLECRRVEDRALRIEFARLNSLAFHIPFEWCRELYDLEALWTNEFTGHIGYVDGAPVCCAATLLAAGAVGVYSVATLPGHERKGYGETITRHAVASAQRESGLTRSVLQATRPGVSLYRRMGYDQVTHFVVYT